MPSQIVKDAIDMIFINHSCAICPVAACDYFVAPGTQIEDEQRYVLFNRTIILYGSCAELLPETTKEQLDGIANYCNQIRKIIHRIDEVGEECFFNEEGLSFDVLQENMRLVGRPRLPARAN